MSDDKGIYEAGDELIQKAGGYLLGLVLALTIGWMFSKYKQSNDKEIVLPDSLEVDPDVSLDQLRRNGRVNPELEKLKQNTAWYVRHFYPIVAGLGFTVGYIFLQMFADNMGTFGRLVLLAITAATGYGLYQYWRHFRAVYRIYETESKTLKWQFQTNQGLTDMHEPLHSLEYEDAPFKDTTVCIISLPHDSRWSPETAKRFMEQVLQKSGHRLTFQIKADSEQTVWRILDLRGTLSPDLLQQTVNAFYPQAQMSITTLQPEVHELPLYRRIIPFKLAVDFYFPILPVEGLQNFDPLVNLTQEVSRLRPGEAVTYTLHIAAYAGFVNDQAEQILTVKTNNLARILTPEGMADLGHELGSGEVQRQSAWEPNLEQLIQSKVHNLVYQGLVLLEITTPDETRLDELTQVYNHIQAFHALPDTNVLVPYRQPWPGAGCYIDEPAIDQAASTLGFLSDWLSNRSRRWQDFRLILGVSEVASLWHLPHEAFQAPTIHWNPRGQVQLPRAMWDQDEGVQLGVNVYGDERHAVRMLDVDRASHTAIIGKPIWANPR